ncbi:MAG: hypothetical protein EZS28_036002 [Streblomastix strix]|uniref:Tyr recombinase domain-containing protein n=1 Tax=Streblomastix strix TaxID=222440 RepID=A0A5J4UEN6_9EUKA|nr:MAG: hypothetical protein EZS28_036002 [Streblomastix strix]
MQKGKSRNEINNPTEENKQSNKYEPLDIRSRIIEPVKNGTRMVDRLSRVENGSDFKLHPSVFNHICTMFRLVTDIDGFGSQWNRQTNKYISWKPEPEAIAVNALAQKWDRDRIWWLFPPIPLITQQELVVQRVRDQMHVMHQSPRQSNSLENLVIKNADDLMKLIPGKFTTQQLALLSFSTNTIDHYKSALNHWIRCVCSRGTVESIRSAVSTIVGLITGKRLGQELLTQIVARGIRKIDPRKSKYRQIWMHIYQEIIFFVWGQINTQMTKCFKQKRQHLFLKPNSLGALSVSQISDLIRMLLQEAGLDTKAYGIYSLKAAGISEQYEQGKSLQQIAKEARLSIDSGVLQKHYIKPIQKQNQQVSQVYHSSLKASASTSLSGSQYMRSESRGEAETRETNEPAQQYELRSRQQIRQPNRLEQDYVLD